MRSTVTLVVNDLVDHCTYEQNSCDDEGYKHLLTFGCGEE